MRNTWLSLLITAAAAVLLTPATWAQHHGGGHAGHPPAGHAGHPPARPAFHGGPTRVEPGYRGWGYPRYYGGGWGAYRGYYPHYYGFYGYYPGVYLGYYPDYYDGYDYGPAYSSYVPPVSSYQSLYPPESLDVTGAPTAPAPTGDAVVRVRVPDPNAKVWFQGVLTAQTGTDRAYESPPLQPGQSYTYDVRAQWNDNGKAVDQARQVQVHAGDRVTVDFLAPAASTTR